MASFISAKNCPIYANFLEENGAINTGMNGHFLVSTEFSLVVDSQIEADKIFGSPRESSGFNVAGQQSAKLSFSFLPLIGSNSALNRENQYGIFNLTGDFYSGHNFLVGNFDLRKCYLSSLNLKISPQEVISVSADFDVYDLSRITGQSYTGANVSNLLTTNNSGAYLEGIHALAMGISGSGASLPESRAEIDVSIRCNREPSYSLGSAEPSTVILTNVEKQVSIQGENVGKIINYSGELAVLDLYFAPFSSFIEGGTGFNGITSSLFSIKTRGRVSSQNLSAGENGLQGNISLVENVF